MFVKASKKTKNPHVDYTQELGLFEWMPRFPEVGKFLVLCSLNMETKRVDLTLYSSEVESINNDDGILTITTQNSIYTIEIIKNN